MNKILYTVLFLLPLYFLSCQNNRELKNSVRPMCDKYEVYYNPSQKVFILRDRMMRVAALLVYAYNGQFYNEQIILPNGEITYMTGPFASVLEAVDYEAKRIYPHRIFLTDDFKVHLNYVEYVRNKSGVVKDWKFNENLITVCE